MTILLIMAGAFLGAIARFGFGQLIKTRSASAFPWATLLVNVTGSFGLGYLLSHTTYAPLLMFLGAGFFGSFTTFSTLKLELMRFASKDWFRFGIYLGATYIFGLLAAYIGWHS